MSLIAGMAIGAGVSIATADSTETSDSFYSVNGVDYFNYEALTTYSTSAQSDAFAETDNGADVPSGWMGASTDLDKSNGSLCSRSGWAYNNSPTFVFDNAVANGCGAAYYYGIGATQGYTGSGYAGYYTNRTVNLYVN